MRQAIFLKHGERLQQNGNGAFIVRAQDGRAVTGKHAVLKNWFHAVSGFNRIHMRIEHQDRSIHVTPEPRNQVSRVVPTAFPASSTTGFSAHGFKHILKFTGIAASFLDTLSI